MFPYVAPMVALCQDESVIGSRFYVMERLVGEPVEVTWWLYNAAAVQQWQVSSIPRLDDFWTEERPKSETPERMPVGDSILQRMPIRRAVLFPLRSGRGDAVGADVPTA